MQKSIFFEKNSLFDEKFYTDSRLVHNFIMKKSYNSRIVRAYALTMPAIGTP